MKFLTSLLFLGSAVQAAASVRGRRRVKDADHILGQRNRRQGRRLKSGSTGGDQPQQSYYVPLPESEMFTQIFDKMNKKSTQPVMSLIAISIAVPGTTIWYDHWEDGYDANIATSHKPTTQVWGDGDPSNGCAPHVNKCDTETDRLKAGDTIILQNYVPLDKNGNRDPNIIKYDGGDRIEASYAIAVTRGGYPKVPGSLLAGAVEVHATENWGTTFEAPFGIDSGATYHAFEYSSLFYMAAYGNTEITLPGGKKVTLGQGESGYLPIKKGQQLKSSKPIQVDLIAGDVKSTFELRWYSLWPLEQFSNSYVTPVGDTFGRTRVLVYNPSNKDTIKVKVTWLGSTYDRRRRRYVWSYQSTILSVAHKQYQLSCVIPTHGGALLQGVKVSKGQWVTDPSAIFVALSLTDTVADITRQDAGTKGEWFDWGFPLVPRNQLSSQVFIGWGFGCTGNNCLGHKDRSVVWLTPMEHADVWIDYSNVGTAAPEKRRVAALQSIKIWDQKDHDMSGALIYATKLNSGSKGPPVDIAAAWGQDPAVSTPVQQISLDLGTTVMPADAVTVRKNVDLSICRGGDILTYYIVVSNIGQLDIESNELTIHDTVDEDADYIEGSTIVVFPGMGKLTDSGKSSFPLDEDGFRFPKSLPRRGGKAVFVYKAKVKETVERELIIGPGHLSQKSRPNKPFKAITRVHFAPEIQVQNKIYLGHDGGKSCGSAVEKVSGYVGDKVTYCFKVTNSGKTKLRETTVDHPEFGFKEEIGVLDSGDSKMLFFQGKIGPEKLTNTVYAKGLPATKTRILAEHGRVKDSDCSSYDVLRPTGKLSVVNTVMKKKDATKEECARNKEKLQSDIAGTYVSYCFTLKNEGPTYLKTMLQNGRLGIRTVLKNPLPPSSSQTFVLKRQTITESFTNQLLAVSLISNDAGVMYTGTQPLRASDCSSVKLLEYGPSISVDNKVYFGHDGGAKCRSDGTMSDTLTDYFGTKITYCFKITNTGEAHLSNVELKNEVLKFEKLGQDNLGTIAPSEHKYVYLEKTIEGTLSNVAEVIGTPVTKDGRALPIEKVEDDDDSGVTKKVYEPEITVENRVALGGSSSLCQTSKAKKLVEGMEQMPITHCFTVRNTGNSWLKNIVMTNPDIVKGGYKIVIEELAPEGMTTVPLVSTMPGASNKPIENTVYVEANPTLKDGTDLPGQKKVTANDKSGVKPFSVKPSVNIENTVYLGDDDGDGCKKGEGVESVTDYVNKPVVYCFNVTNTGNVPLKEIVVKNPAFDYEQPIRPLLPGSSRVLPYPSVIKVTANNEATVTAVPFITNDLPDLTPVEDSDWSEVVRKMYNKGIEVKSTVYKGEDGGAKCKLSTKNRHADIYKTPVVYCHAVTNTGEVPLDEVTVTNSKLGFSKKLEKVLEPNETIVLSSDGEIEEDLETVTVAVGTPTDPDGGKIPGTENVSAESPVGVVKLSPKATIKVRNTVTLGHDGPESCGNAKEAVQDRYKGKVTYCFEVENTSRDLHLRNLQLNNRVLDYTLVNDDDFDMAPGAKKLITVEAEILEAIENLARVKAIPYTADGRKICDHDPVTDEDPSNVGMIASKPAVAVTNRVYTGPAVDGKCATAKEQVRDRQGAEVTFCFTITNEGETSLNKFMIDNEVLGHDSERPEVLHKGESFIVVHTGAKIPEMDTTNTVVVVATPVLEDETVIPHLKEVEAEDNSKVLVQPLKASIVVKNTIYKGHDDGATCTNGEATEDKLKDYVYTKLTHCYTVTNTGEADLVDVDVQQVQNPSDKPKTDGANKKIPSLKAGETKTVHIESRVVEDLRDIVTVTGTPTSPSDAPTVSDTDKARIDAVNYKHEIAVDNTVLKGHKPPSACSAGLEREEGFMNTKITHCFVVTNKGTSTLAEVSLKNADLDDYTHTFDSPLKPTESQTVVIDSKIVKTFPNKVYATGNPVNEDLEPIPGATPVDDDDDAEVVRIYRKAGIQVETKIYKGDEESKKKCKSDDAMDKVSGYYGTAIVYCFFIRNVGDVHLGSIKPSNDVFDISGAQIPQLAGGDEHIITLKSIITEDKENTLSATGNPVEEDGTDISYLDEVDDEYTTEVEYIPLGGGIRVTNLVSLEDGECGVTDHVEGMYNTPCTYCLITTNTGDVDLEEVKVFDEVLGVEETIPMLPSGAEYVVKVPKKILEDSKNTAVATSTKASKEGAPITNIGQLEASDDSSVRLLELPASITLDNNVYLKKFDDRSECNNGPQNLVENYRGAEVVYCLLVTNNDMAPLNNIRLTSTQLSLDVTLEGVILKKDDTYMVPVVRQILEDLDNDVKVTANPALEDGTDIPGADDVSANDGSSVRVLGYSAEIDITHLVYHGDDADGSGCGTAKNEVTEKKGEPVVYCYKVKNTGSVHLANVRITTDHVGYSHPIGILKPQEETTFFHSSGAIGGEQIINEAIATGTPALPSGAGISGATDVTDAESVTVSPKRSGDVKTGEKDPYKPPEDPSPCLQDNWKELDQDGDLICPAVNQIMVSNLRSDDTPVKTCKPGEDITITVDASMTIMGEKKDVGWYVATDGGDALTGTCAVNGFQSRNSYSVVDGAAGSTSVGKVVWKSSNGGDDDTCGDFLLAPGQANGTVNLPLIVETTVKCKDENEDGILDTAICFTWRQDSDECQFTKNIPDMPNGSCFCTRIDIPDIEVETPDVVPC